MIKNWHWSIAISSQNSATERGPNPGFIKLNLNMYTNSARVLTIWSGEINQHKIQVNLSYFRRKGLTDRDKITNPN